MSAAEKQKFIDAVGTIWQGSSSRRNMRNSPKRSKTAAPESPAWKSREGTGIEYYARVETYACR